jgi:hypothetical protein
VTQATQELTLWQQVVDASPKDGNGWDSGFSVREGERGRRDTFIERFGFAVPTPPAIKAISQFVGQRKVLEVGAGTGLWARLLSDAGVVVTAVDDWSGKYNKPMKVGTHYPIERVDGIEAVKRHEHKALLLCWPDYDDPIAAAALKAFCGDRLVYIGEGESGCTGDDRFHKMLRHWELVQSIALPQWPGIHDELTLHRRNSP